MEYQIVTDRFGNEHITEEIAPSEFRSTPKEIWEAQQVEHLTEIPTV